VQWILRKNMFDVGQEQFLVLLFVVQPQDNQRLHLLVLLVFQALHELKDGIVDVPPILASLGHSWPGYEAAAIPAMHGPGEARGLVRERVFGCGVSRMPVVSMDY
jgi:hypothetical protein